MTLSKAKGRIVMLFAMAAAAVCFLPCGTVKAYAYYTANDTKVNTVTLADSFGSDSILEAGSEFNADTPAAVTSIVFTDESAPAGYTLAYNEPANKKSRGK